MLTPRISVLLFVVLFSASCADFNLADVDYDLEVEIAPGKWLPVSFGDSVHVAPISRKSGDRESSRLSFDCRGRIVKWSGPEIPITLRKYLGTFYLIGFNRERPDRTALAFFKTDTDCSRFLRISARDFPRQIATQNLWLNPQTRFIWVGDTRVDKWNVLRNLDIDNRYFNQSLTAYIWFQIETGKELHEMPRLVDRAFLRKFVSDHNPIALPTIVREPVALEE